MAKPRAERPPDEPPDDEEEDEVPPKVPVDDPDAPAKTQVITY
jgi:hypothetical protein